MNSNPVDFIILAEIPDPEIDRPLYEIVKIHEVHGPCGYQNLQSPCMKEGKCTEKYPKKFILHTQFGKDRYPSEEGNQKMEESQPKLEFMRLTIDG